MTVAAAPDSDRAITELVIRMRDNLQIKDGRSSQLIEIFQVLLHYFKFDVYFYK